MSEPHYSGERIINEDLFPRSGDRVFWFGEGHQSNAPCPAIVNVDSHGQRALSITVFTSYGPVIKDAVKHVDAEASEIDRRHNGGWAWNRKAQEK